MIRIIKQLYQSPMSGQNFKFIVKYDKLLAELKFNQSDYLKAKNIFIFSLILRDVLTKLFQKN